MFKTTMSAFGWIRGLGIGLRRAGIAATVSCVLSGGAVMANTVYVFNGGNNNQGKANDIFNGACQGWIFTNLGLLGPNGEYPTVDGDNLKQGDTVVGRVIRNADGTIIGYENADGSMKAFNVDITTTAYAWGQVSDDGTFVIAKHGIRGGGGITLDGGRAYDGFTDGDRPGPGTGRGLGGGAYPLPPRPDADIHLWANSCYSDRQPQQDPDPDREKPVTGSGDDVPGVGSTDGYEDVTTKSVSYVVDGETQEAIDAAVAKLEECARKAGFKKKDGSGDIAAWIANQPMPDQHRKATECIAGTGGTIAISYAKAPCGDAAGACDYIPLMAGTLLPETIFETYQPSPDHHRITFLADSFSLPLGEAVQVGPASIPIEILPMGLAPATYPVIVRRYGLEPQVQFNNPVQLQVTVNPEDMPQFVGVFELREDGTMLPVPWNFFDPGSDPFIGWPVFHDGVYVPLMQMPVDPPCPGDISGDGVVDLLDLSLLLSQFGQTGNGLTADLNGDGAVDLTDLSIMLSNYGVNC